MRIAGDFKKTTMNQSPTPVYVIWSDSHGVESGWRDISDYKTGECIIESIGFVIYENDKVIALAHNYGKETEHTPQQANGIMVIPKACIIKITSFPSYREFASRRKRRHFSRKRKT
ncbi:hypothetical protein EZS27_027502 [termite gut metagenome]|uniref:Uncharacterized protein n=1 Tax=termite gut metagenome TaxID=433724 RepID=A0A5J4QMB5_9ZZZZ